MGRHQPHASSDARHILVIGGGITGLSTALALQDAVAGLMSVAIADPALSSGAEAVTGQRDTRAYALGSRAIRLLTRLGVWAAIEPEAQPLRRMIVTDSRVSDVVRPTYLNFSAEPGPGTNIASMVEDSVVTAALKSAAIARGIAFIPQGIESVRSSAAGCVVRFMDGDAFACELVVAADGSRSRTREEAGIGWVGWDYGQTAIVGTVVHERPHEGRAEEHFLPSGPFAILPLTGLRSSIVWTEAKADAQALLALDQDDQLEELARRFGRRHGDLRLIGRLKGLPLNYGIARGFVGARLALVGDAAHVIHPLAGQGLNLGLNDAEALADVIGRAVAVGLDAGDAMALKNYEMARRTDTLRMGLLTDGLNRLFSNDIGSLRLIRDLGLGLVDASPSIKRFLISQASGGAGIPA